MCFYVGKKLEVFFKLKGEDKMLFGKNRITHTEEQIKFWENEIEELRQQLQDNQITYEYFLETFEEFEKILEEKKHLLTLMNGRRK